MSFRLTQHFWFPDPSHFDWASPNRKRIFITISLEVTISWDPVQFDNGVIRFVGLEAEQKRSQPFPEDPTRELANPQDIPNLNILSYIKPKTKI